MEIGNRIREERDRHNMTQEDLAQRIFVSRQTVSNWETGKTYPDVQSLLLLSNLFDVTIDSLVKGDAMTMDKELQDSAKKLNRLGNSMAGFAVVAVVGAIAFMVLDSKEAAITWFVVFWLASLVGAAAAERIKKSHNLTTYAQIKAFMEGEDPESAEQPGLPKWADVLVKLLAGAAVGAAFMAIAFGVLRALGLA